ncbi:MAG: AsmA family protein [Terracidiphilus sp.]
MTEEEKPRQTNRKRWLVLAVLAALLALLIVPPFLSVSRYKARITQLISASLGRPVRLSSVEVRMLPRPGFVLYDLTVEEDPAYGTEPVLHAESVAASIRLLSLWRGQIELDSISVDYASLNLVRTPAGRWNLDSLLRTATAHAQSALGSSEGGDATNLGKLDKPVKLPYLQATNSRINIKSGAEKLPFSLIDAKFSLEQQSPGDWRVQLRGEPARTDLSIGQADTGVLRLTANLHQAPELRQMPVRADMEWREAQLGQLTRLLLGSDAGWRGDLTGQLHLEGTADAAQIKTRLRATGVHRAEFAPAEPMDFDANCAFVAHFSIRAIDNLLCDSPLGSGRIRLNGSLPGQGSLPSFSVELERVSVAAALDALRSVRSGFAPGLDAAGSASGKLSFSPLAPLSAAPLKILRSAKDHPAVVGPLTGSLAVTGLQFSGSGLNQPVVIPELILKPAPVLLGQPQTLTATAAVAAGGAAPLTVSARLTLSGYQITVRGQASISRGRELARAAGLANTLSLDSMAGDPVAVDLTAQGPWMQLPPAIQTQLPQLPSESRAALAPADTLAGTMVFHNANWKAEFLANSILISQATLHLSASELRWEPVIFAYGPVKGTASLSLPVACDSLKPCLPSFLVQFGALDAAVVQTAFLGAHEKGTLLSTLIDRLRPSAAPAWPQMNGTVKAESLLLGPVTLRNPVATVSTLAKGAEITAFDAAMLGGCVHASGSYHAAATAKDKPSYELEGLFDKLSPTQVGQLLGLRSTGGTFNGNGKIALTGFTGDDLASSAKGSLHFEWQRGTIAGTAGLPPALARFDRWTADAAIANGALTLQENQVKQGGRSAQVQATVTLAVPAKIAFAVPKAAPAKP